MSTLGISKSGNLLGQLAYIPSSRFVPHTMIWSASRKKLRQIECYDESNNEDIELRYPGNVKTENMHSEATQHDANADVNCFRGH
jgi:hypothetical protein